VFTLLRVAVGVLLVVVLIKSGAIDWSVLLRIAANWWVVAAAIALFMLSLLMMAWRACVLLRPRGFEMSLGASFQLSLIGVLFNTCLPGATGGDAVRIYYATAGNTGRKTEVVTILLLDRAIGMLSLLLLPLPFVALAPELSENGIIRGLMLAAAAIAGVIVLGMLIVFLPFVRTSRAFEWLRGIPVGRVFATIIDTVHAYRKHIGALFAALGLSLVAQLMTLAVLVLFARAVSPGAPVWRAASVIPLGLLANGIPATPGGLGVGEAAFAQLFQMTGLSGGAEVMLGWRFLSLIGAAAGLVLFLKGKSRYVSVDRPAPATSGVPAAV
jgi:uncharacterized protein (TIRG00374 family)